MSESLSAMQPESLNQWELCLFPIKKTVSEVSVNSITFFFGAFKSKK